MNVSRVDVVNVSRVDVVSVWRLRTILPVVWPSEVARLASMPGLALH